MPKAKYDAIVVGGGHHGSIIACYLGAAGLKVGVFERKAQIGGGATSRKGPVPGFLMNICAHWTRFYGHPAYRDFDLGSEGLRYVFPDENEGMVFDDGSSYIGYSAYRVVDYVTGRQEYSQHNVDRTHKQISNFSSVTPPPISTFSTNTPNTGNRRFRSTASPPLRHGGHQIRLRRLLGDLKRELSPFINS